jgi:hypothetical protein
VGPEGYAKKESAKRTRATTGTKAAYHRKSVIFISHDSRDADLAEAFGNLLTDASGGILKSFRSSDRKGNAGIEYGQEWYRAIMQKLDDATDVVALLTARSINRPWILYETGVAKGKLNANDRVFGIALGVALDEAATGPFAQFQNSPDEEDAITSLVLQLIRRHPQAAPREEAVRRQVQAFRESVASLLKDRKKDTAQPQAKVVEVWGPSSLRCEKGVNTGIPPQALHRWFSGRRTTRPLVKLPRPASAASSSSGTSP